MWILILVIVGLYLHAKSKTIKPVPSQVGTASVPPLSNKSGGTSTPTTFGVITPDLSHTEKAALPPFYQQSNAATPSTPKTSLSVGKFGEAPPSLPLSHVNYRLAGEFSASPAQPVTKPISKEFISDNEVEQVAYENDTAYGKGSIATPIAVENPSIFASPIIAKPITVNAPSAVANAPYYANNGVPNTLAPNPPANPTFEATVPEIAAAIVKGSYTPESNPITTKWLA